jgi:hypothetical protein
MERIFALHDWRQDQRYPIECSLEEAKTFNNAGYGIFWCVNEYETFQRRAANLTKINYWFCEIDTQKKASQLQYLQKCPLIPNLVIESKNGFHVYWRAQNATLENFKEIVRCRLIPYFSADPKASDVLRLLRCPEFYHHKDPADSFLVKKVWDLEGSYTEEQMLRMFKPKQKKEKVEWFAPTENMSFWQQVASIDGREAIHRVSGTHWCCFEEFYLKELNNGNANIIRSDTNTDTGSFVNGQGRLCGVDNGASIGAWIQWYGFSWSEVKTAIEELFPDYVNTKKCSQESIPAEQATTNEQGSCSDSNYNGE